MRAFIAAVLSVIAGGVLLIAYGLLSPRTPSADPLAYPYAARPLPAGQRAIVDDGYGYAPGSAYGYPLQRSPSAYPAYETRPVPQYVAYEPPRRFASTPVTTRTAPTRVIERAPRRDWARTAMVIGGTTAAGAGLGGIFGGKKGALIGAAIGGGAGTLYEVNKQ
jgi:hypothetical protein